MYKCAKFPVNTTFLSEFILESWMRPPFPPPLTPPAPPDLERGQKPVAVKIFFEVHVVGSFDPSKSQIAPF